jgi:GxxExxY protein
MLHKNLTDKIIGSFYQVYNTLGYGFLEKVYENAMVIELTENHLQVLQQKKISVFYKKANVGDYTADLIVDNKVIIELKAAESLCNDHKNQLINYLKATEFEVGLLLNFGPKPEVRRVLFTKDHKQIHNSQVLNLCKSVLSVSSVC